MSRTGTYDITDGFIPDDEIIESYPPLLLIPTAEVVPLRHGRLLHANPYGECSLCGYLIDIRDSYNYCPKCGAKLDGGIT